MLSTTDTVRRYDGPFTLNQVINYNIPYISNEDLVITVDGQVLIYGGDYGVQPIKSEGLIVGATVTLYKDVPGNTMVILRKTPPTQEQNYPENGPFESTDIERSLDKLTMLAQENRYDNQRFIKINNAEIASYDNELPAATDKPQMIIVTNEKVYLDEADPKAIRAAQAAAEKASATATEKADVATTKAEEASESADRAWDAASRAEAASLPIGQEKDTVLTWSEEEGKPVWEPLPPATDTAPGVVVPDNYTLMVQDGMIYANQEGSFRNATTLAPLVHDKTEFTTNVIDIGGYAVLSPSVFAEYQSTATPFGMGHSGTRVCDFSFHETVGSTWFSTDNQINGRPPKIRKEIHAGTYYKPEPGDTIRLMQQYSPANGGLEEWGTSFVMGKLDDEGHFTPILVFQNSHNWTNKNLYYIPGSRLPEFTYPDPGAGQGSYYQFYFSGREFGKPLDDVCTIYRADESSPEEITFINGLVEDVTGETLLAQRTVVGVKYKTSDGGITHAQFDKVGWSALSEINYIIFECPVAENFDVVPSAAMKYDDIGIFAGNGAVKWVPGKTVNNNSLGMRWDDDSLGVNEVGELYAKAKPLAPATTDTLGGVKPDGKTITVTSDGTITAVGGGGGGGGGSDLYGIRGDYATHFGILDCPKGLIDYKLDERTVTVHAGIVLQCAGASYKTTIASDMAYTISSVDDVVLFYAEGSIIEAGDVFYQEDEPNNGTSSYAAWYNPSSENKKWQFKSNDTGNVWREAFATPIANIGITDGVITRVDYIGYRILDDDILAHKSDIPQGTFDAPIAPLNINRVENIPANLSTYKDGQFVFLNNVAYSVVTSPSLVINGATSITLRGHDTTKVNAVGNAPLNLDSYMQFTYTPRYGDKWNFFNIYRTGNYEDTPYTSSKFSVLFGQLDADGYFTPRISGYGSSYNYYLTIYTGEPTSYSASTKALSISYTSGVNILTRNFNYQQSAYKMDYFELKEVDGLLDIELSVQNGTATYNWATGLTIDDIGDINCCIVSLGKVGSDVPSTSTDMMKLSDAWIERDGVKIWTPGEVTRGAFLQVACDNTTVQVVNGKLSAKTPALGGLSLVKLTKDEYTALATKDASTIYVVTDTAASMFELYLGTLSLTLA